MKHYHGIGSLSMGNGFDIVSAEFCLHYFFKDITTLNIFLENVSSNLKVGGKFVGTCLDGKEVFQKLSVTPILERRDSNTLLWKINKKYTKTSLEDNESSLGLPIDIYVESINQTITEWLVNFDFLAAHAQKYGLKLESSDSFSSIFDKWQSRPQQNDTYGSIDKMTPELKDYSFLNKTFIFVKV